MIFLPLLSERGRVRRRGSSWYGCDGVCVHYCFNFGHLSTDRYLSTAGWLILVKASSSSVFAPTKLLPWSCLSHEAGPWIEKNLLRANMKEPASIVSITK